MEEKKPRKKGGVEEDNTNARVPLCVCLKETDEGLFFFLLLQL